MNNDHSELEKYTRMNGLECAYKYIYDHQVPLDKIDYQDPALRECFKIDQDRFSLQEMIGTLRQFAQATAKMDYLSTELLIPHGRRIYIRKWPCYMPVKAIYHNDAVIVHYVWKGRVPHTVNGVSFDLCDGDMCLIAPEVQYQLFIDDPDVVMFSIFIYTDVTRELLSHISLEKDILSEFFSKILYGNDFIPFLFCDIGVDHLIRQIILDMIESQEEEEVFANQYLRSALEYLFLRLLKNHKSHIISGSGSLKHETRITTIMSYAEAHCEMITLEALAARYNYSYNYLSAMIKNHYGHSFNEIMAEVKMNKAASLLRSTGLSIGDIAEQTGYQDKSQFHRQFKKKFHQTPAQYRKSMEP